MGARKPTKKRAGTKAKGDDQVMRLGTAQDWRSNSSPPSKEAKEKKAGPLRIGTAKDWRKAVAKKTTKNAASAAGQTSSPKRKAEKMRGG